MDFDKCIDIDPKWYSILHITDILIKLISIEILFL